MNDYDIGLLASSPNDEIWMEEARKCPPIMRFYNEVFLPKLHPNDCGHVTQCFRGLVQSFAEAFPVDIWPEWIGHMDSNVSPGDALYKCLGCDMARLKRFLLENHKMLLRDEDSPEAAALRIMINMLPDKEPARH